MRARNAHSRGFQLVELIVALALAAILAALTVPPLLNASSGLRLQLAAYELVGVLRTARTFAVLRSSNVAVKFRHEMGRVTFALYRDGDGDGVLNQDITSGIDPQVAPARPLVYLGRDVDFGFPPGPPPRDPGDPTHRLDRLDDPIRFNSSDLASFNSIGASTPGSAYLTDGRRKLAVVRVYGRTAKVKVLMYDPERERWR
jgi:prepilin-type N-terminal cleavage/methylation domain-containing protein